MGYLIDTNVLSELGKGMRADPGVRTWYATTRSEDLYLSVLVIGEVRQGIERLRRRDPQQAEQLERRMGLLQAGLTDRILPVSRPVAECWVAITFRMRSPSLMGCWLQRPWSTGLHW